jgi:hypothetical protein
MNLLFSFDSRMNWYGEDDINMHLLYDMNLDYIYDIYKASMINCKKFKYKIIFYGDSYSLKKLEGYYDECVSIDHKNFELLDDLKIWIHTQNDLSCVTFDGDIILHSKLNFEKDNLTDVWFETREEKGNKSRTGVLHEDNDSYNGYTTMLEIFKSYNTNKFISDYKYDGSIACNVGIIKFNNQRAKDILINGYYNLRKFYFEKIKPNNDFRKKGMLPSLIVCQYNFGNLININNISTSYIKDYNKHYIHLAGELKFLDDNKKMVYNIINNQSKDRFI